jgi:hypothetical protein
MPCLDRTLQFVAASMEAAFVLLTMIFVRAGQHALPLPQTPHCPPHNSGLTPTSLVRPLLSTLRAVSFVEHVQQRSRRRSCRARQAPASEEDGRRVGVSKRKVRSETAILAHTAATAAHTLPPLLRTHCRHCCAHTAATAAHTLPPLLRTHCPDPRTHCRHCCAQHHTRTTPVSSLHLGLTHCRHCCAQHHTRTTPVSSLHLGLTHCRHCCAQHHTRTTPVSSLHLGLTHCRHCCAQHHTRTTPVSSLHLGPTPPPSLQQPHGLIHVGRRRTVSARSTAQHSAAQRSSTEHFFFFLFFSFFFS